MLAALRSHWPLLRRLILAFGLFGLAVWPAAGWYGYELITGEIAKLHDGIRITHETILGRDFVNIWHGGRMAAVEGADMVYDRPAYRVALFQAAGITGIYAFSYPPHMLMLAVPFGIPSYLWSLAAWLAITFAVFAWGARPWLRQAGLPAWSVLLLPGAVVNLWAGHFGFLIAGLTLLGWWNVQRRPGLAGASFAVLSVKPHMGILVPLVLLARREWLVIACTTLGVLVLVLASTLVFGISAWTTWLTSTLSFQVGLIDPGALRQYYYMMPTVNRMALSIDRQSPVLLVQILFGLSALGLLGWAGRRRVNLPDLGLLTIAATPLLLPYLFNYDLVGLSLAALVWAARSPARWWSPERLAYGVAFLVPITQVPFAKAGFWISPIVILITLAFAAWRLGGVAASDEAAA